MNMTIQEYSQRLIDFCNGMASVWRQQAFHGGEYASGITYACDAMIREIEKLEEDREWEN